MLRISAAISKLWLAELLLLRNSLMKSVLMLIPLTLLPQLRRLKSL